MSPALALAYLFWTRYRRGLIRVGGYWLAAMIFCLVLPAGAFNSPPNGPPSLAMFVPFFIFFVILPMAAVGDLILVFLFAGEEWLQGRVSGFPPRLWVLPLPTHALVGWPMLWGSATMLLFCMTLAWAARRPFGADLPLVWPGLLLAVVLAWLQAIAWTPFPLPLLRAFSLIPVASVLFLTPVDILECGVPSAAICGLLAVLLSAAYLTAIRGVARARHGDNVKWGWPTWLRWPWAARTRPPFLSAAAAQLWLEWRLHGLLFPVMTAFYTVITLLILLLIENLDDLKGEKMSLFQTWIVMLWIPPTVWMCGMAMGRLGTRLWRLSSFLATRPVSSAMLLRAKFAAAAWNTLAGWGVLAVGLLLWLALSGQMSEAVQQLEAMRQRYEPRLFWGWLVLLVVGSIVLIWLQMVQCMWIGLLRSRRALLLFFCGFYVYVMLSSFIFLLPDHTEYWSEYRPIFDRLLPWLAGTAVLLKTLAAAWSLHALKRRRLIPSGVLWGMPAIWLTVAAGVFAALYALLPDNWFSAPGVVLGIVLLLPLTRLALAPLALSWNRHR